VDFSRDVKRADIGPKFTNIYPKRGISVNLPRLCEVGLLGEKAGVGFNIFKEPVTQQLRAWRTESQNKSYIASETYFGVIAIVTVIAYTRDGHQPSLVRRCFLLELGIAATGIA
jgi:hypothetical protein